MKATKHSLAGSSLRGDPALLADEAGAIDMFGGAKVIWIQPAGEEMWRRGRGPARRAGLREPRRRDCRKA